MFIKELDFAFTLATRHQTSGASRAAVAALGEPGGGDLTLTHDGAGPGGGDGSGSWKPFGGGGKGGGGGGPGGGGPRGAVPRKGGGGGVSGSLDCGGDDD